MTDPQDAQSEKRSSFSDDIGKAFDDIGIQHNKTPEVPQTATLPSAAGYPVPRAVDARDGVSGAANQGSTVASQVPNADAYVPPVEPASVLPQGDVQAVSLDGDTMVYFIDDGTEFKEEQVGGVAGGQGVHAGSANAGSAGQDLQDTARSTDQGVNHASASGAEPRYETAAGDGLAGNGAAAAGLGAAGLGAGAAGLGAAGIAASGSHDNADAAAPPAQQVSAAPGNVDVNHPASVNGTKSYDPSTISSTPSINQPSDSRPAENDSSSRGAASLAAAGAATLGVGAASAGALARTSGTRLGDERADSSASITAIHGGSEGKPVRHSQEHNGAGGAERPDNLHLGELPPPRPITDDADYPMGSPDIPGNTTSSLGVPGHTKRGFDPAESTASITAIRSGNEGNTPSPSAATAGQHLQSPLAQTVTADNISDTTIPAPSSAENAVAAQVDGDGPTTEPVQEAPAHSANGAIAAGAAGAGVATGAGAAAAAKTEQRHEVQGAGSPEDAPPTPTSGFQTADGGSTPGVASERTAFEPKAEGDAVPHEAAHDGEATATDSTAAASSAPTKDTSSTADSPKTTSPVPATSKTNGATDPSPASAAGASSATRGTKGHQRTVSSTSSARRRKVSLLSKLKGEMKVLSGRMSHDDKKVAEGERLKSGE